MKKPHRNHPTPCSNIHTSALTSGRCGLPPSSDENNRKKHQEQRTCAGDGRQTSYVDLVRCRFPLLSFMLSVKIHCPLIWGLRGLMHFLWFSGFSWFSRVSILRGQTNSGSLRLQPSRRRILRRQRASNPHVGDWLHILNHKRLSGK